ncbi:arsenate reductase (glutaredoxin) [Brevundimonas fluminis]|jgi:arsenate reductase|uniref:arsenate reductase (glutaredoxin) n=1 Tax=Brevundimonas fluminis TaxID=2487274 RepID=UPI000F656E6E|nr:arsenate reductase (glutaredoxin) [Brevundimonas fluminis]
MSASVTIYHNPACGTSGRALALIRQAGVEPRVVEYLRTGWTRPQLQGLLSDMGLTARDVLRVSNSPAEEMGLTDPAVPDDALIDAMVAHPILVNRPIVVTPAGTILARPEDKVLPLLGGL